MRGGAMKKLILIPTVVMTAFLAFAFLAPATASGILKTVAPALETGHASVLGVHFSEAGVASSSTVAPGSSTQTAGPGAPASSTRSTSTPQVAGLQTSSQGVHEVSTAGETNCGRFGNGHHGGKHDFTCPNKPFPPPAT